MSQIYRTGQGNERISLESGGMEAAKWLGGIAAGALLMYMLDPERGSARRAQSAAAVRNVWRGTGERMASLADGARAAVGNALPESVGDAAGRAGSALARAGRAVSDAMGDVMGGDTLARAKDVAVRAADTLQEGRERAKDAMRDTASRIADSADDARSAARPERGAWGSMMRNTAAAAGGAMAVGGLMRRSPLGWAIGLAGFALLARGIANRPLRSMLSLGAMGAPLQQTIDFDKSIHINAAPEEVYDFWTNYENFPRFMSHVVEVRDLGRRRSHWVVRGPGGSEFSWNSVLTEQSRPHRLAWRSEPGAEIPQSGSIEFTPQRGGTHVTVRMSYTPPAGALGHGLATLLGSDPKAKMDEDLTRMKAYIERGVAPPDAAQTRAGSRHLH
jgi:uncharacterized membrane protein